MALLDLPGVVNTSAAATTAIGSAPGTTTSGIPRAGAEILLTAVEEDGSTAEIGATVQDEDKDAAAAGTTTIDIIGTIGAALAEDSRAGATLSTRLLFAMIFPGGTTKGAEVVLVPEEAMVAVEEVQGLDEDRRVDRLLAAVALEGGRMILAVDLVVVAAMEEEAEAEEEVEEDEVLAEATTTTVTTTNLFPRKPGGCSSSPTSPSSI